jgi:hypothetical protein
VSLEGQSPWWYWFGLVAVFLAGFAAVPLVSVRGYGMKWQYKKRQIILSMVAHILWVASIGTFQGVVPLPAAIVTMTLGLFTVFATWTDPGTNSSSVAEPIPMAVSALARRNYHIIPVGGFAPSVVSAGA